MKGMSGEEKSEGKESLGGKEREKSERRRIKWVTGRKGHLGECKQNVKYGELKCITHESGKRISKKKNRVGKRWRNGSGQVLRKATSHWRE